MTKWIVPGECQATVNGIDGTWMVIDVVTYPDENILDNDRVRYKDKDKYSFQLSPQEVYPYELSEISGIELSSFSEDDVDAFDDELQEFEEEVNDYPFWFHGHDLDIQWVEDPNDDDDDDDEWDEMLRVGDEVLWRQSLPQKHLLQPVNAMFDGTNMYEWVDNSGSYWQAYGPIRKGIVQVFRDVEEQDRLQPLAVPWTEIRAGNILVQIGTDIEGRNMTLPERQPEFSTEGAYKVVFNGDVEEPSDEAWLKAIQAVVDAEKTQYGDTGLVHNAWSFVYRDLLPQGYIRLFPEVTSGKFVWKEDDDDAPDVPDKTPPSGIVPPDVPGSPPSIIPPEIIGEIVPPEIPQIIPPEIEEEEKIIPPEIQEELIIPPEIEEVPPEEDIIPPPVKPKKKKKKKEAQTELEVYA